MEEAREEIERLLGTDPPPFPQGILSPDEGVVQGCGRPLYAACLG